MNSSTIESIAQIVGTKNVLTSEEDKIVYSYDGTPLLQQKPEAVVFPETAEHISQLLKLAKEDGFRIVPRGSGTGLSGGSIPVENSIALVMTRWNKILEVDESNLTATVQPGVITSHLHKEAEKRGLFYPPDPGSMNICTLGGNVAENAGGLRGLKYGVTKDYVMGMELVLPDGQILTIGGKNVKDVAGYSLKDVFIGSEGTLGIITKIDLKLIPKPTSSVTLLAFFDTVPLAGEAVSEIIAAKLTPCMMEFLDNTTLRCVEEYTGLGLPTDKEAVLLIEVDGRGSSVVEDAALVESILLSKKAQYLSKSDDPAESLRLKAARRTAFSALARQRPTTILEDATVPISKLPEMLERIQYAAKKFELIIGNFGHAGDGNLHPTCLTDERNHAEILRVHKAFDYIFEQAVALGGTITGEHGTGLAKKQFFEKIASRPALHVMNSLKQVLDPDNLLNPGKIFTFKPKCESLLYASPRK